MAFSEAGGGSLVNGRGMAEVIGSWREVQSCDLVGGEGHSRWGAHAEWHILGVTRSQEGSSSQLDTTQPADNSQLASIAERTAVYAETASSSKPTSPEASTFDIGLLYFSCAHRGRAGKIYVTATHVAFVPLLFGRRVVIHLDRIQCLIKPPTALRRLRAPGSSLRLQLQTQDPRKSSRQLQETFHIFWDRDQLIAGIKAAAAARGITLTVYAQRRIRLPGRRIRVPAASTSTGVPGDDGSAAKKTDTQSVTV